MTGFDVEAARKVLLDSLPRDPKWVVWVDGVVERLTGCVTVDPRLAQIRALCDEAGHLIGEPAAWLLADKIRAVLDAAPVAATPPQGIDLRDPETANAVADAIVRYHGGGYVPLSVRYPWQFQSRTWQAIDRDALRQRLCEWEAVEPHEVADGLLDDIIALVRPVEVVTLTPEELPALRAALAVSLETEPWNEPIASTLRALAARLEAAQ